MCILLILNIRLQFAIINIKYKNLSIYRILLHLQNRQDQL